MESTASLPFRRRVCCGILSPLKIHHPLLGLNPRTLGPMASMLTITPSRTTYPRLQKATYSQHKIFSCDQPRQFCVNNQSFWTSLQKVGFNSELKRLMDRENFMAFIRCESFKPYTIYNMSLILTINYQDAWRNVFHETFIKVKLKHNRNISCRSLHYYLNLIIAPHTKTYPAYVIMWWTELIRRFGHHVEHQACGRLCMSGRISSEK
jgi:hypothetical protein